MNTSLIFVISFLLIGMSIDAQRNVNYNEEDVPDYELPDLLTLASGALINSSEEWELKRRPEILQLFESEVYGKIPSMVGSPVSVEEVESDSALNGSAIRKQIEIVYRGNDREIKIHVLTYLPKEVESPPIFLGYNFYGNHTVIDDPNVIMTDSWVRNNREFGIDQNQSTEASRGKRSHRWPIQKIVDEGFGMALVYYGDVDPDRNDFTDGIHSLYFNLQDESAKEWSSISAWAWGLSEVLTVLKTEDALTESKFIAFGHSRLGKTSLWAGALDKRFDIVISNDSGCGGAALFRRKYGETAAIINKSFPHWFNPKFKEYSGNEDAIPIDQHMLIALMAPRPVYIASAEEDRWADPKGEYLSGYYASPVYKLYNKKGLESDQQPGIHEAVHNTIGYHVRSGKHDVTNYDWGQYIQFAKNHFGK